MSTQSHKELMNGVASDIGQAFMHGIKAAVDASLDESQGICLRKMPSMKLLTSNRGNLKPAIDEALDERLDKKFKEQEELILSSHDAFEKRLDDKYGKLQDTITQNTQAQINAALSKMLGKSDGA